MYIILV